MWATFKSHLTPMSSGNCSRYSLKYPMAAREPSGLVCTAAGLMGTMHELSPRQRMQFSFSPSRIAETP